MNFSYSKSLNTKQIKRKIFQNFIGIDKANSTIDVSPQRAIFMKNFIHKDGINHKRHGWEEVMKILDPGDESELSINGFWNYTDSFGNTHNIIHAGTKIFKINFIDKTYSNITLSCTYYPNYIDGMDVSLWKTKVSDGIVNQRSFGIVRGDRLYILAGNIFLVYGTWNGGSTYELRPVMENSDTYVPTTTIGISANLSAINVRTPHDEINLLTRKRINKLIGEDIDSPLLTKKVDLSNYLYPAYFEGGVAGFTNHIYYKCIGKSNIDCPSFNGVYVSFTLTYSSNTYVYSGTIPLSIANQFGWAYIYNIATLDSYLSCDDVNGPSLTTIGNGSNEYEENKLSFYMRFKYDSSNKKLEAICAYAWTSTYILSDFKLIAMCDEDNLVYQLDSTNLDDSFFVVKCDGFVVPNSNYSVDYEKGTLTFEWGVNYAPSVSGQSNLTVEFIPTQTDYYASCNKINKCKFGIVFGYNEIEHLFISGNANFPNYDWHSSERDSSEGSSIVTIYEDLTYFGDLGYAALGSPTQEITGYSLLGDTTLAIHKKYSANEPCLYLRNSYLGNAIDGSGNIIYDINGSPYQKVYYNQISSAIGEGCITHFCNTNLAGDKLMLSSNGLFGVTLSSNIKSTERYAKERSRMINPQLLKESNLNNATAICYENRLYLAINNNVYIADARYSSQQNAEMDDTFSYEWWVWENVPVWIWFIYNNELYFGSNDGKICKFTSDSYVDKYLINIPSASITFNSTNNTFILSNQYTDKLMNVKNTDDIIVKKTSGNLYEVIIEADDIERIANGIIYVKFDKFFDCVRFLNNKKVYIKNRATNQVGLVESTEYTIKDIDSASKSFKLYNEDSAITSIGHKNFDVCAILSKCEIVNFDRATGTLQLLDYKNNVFVENQDVAQDNTNVIKKLIDYDNTGFINLTAEITVKNNVECTWLTPYIDFGTTEYSKNLLSISVTPEVIEGGKVKVGVMTRDNDLLFNVEGINVLDFENIDFDNFTFDTTDFAKTFTKKIKIKNKNYFQFMFGSIDDKDCAINNISMTYTLGKKNKGVK